MRLNVLQRLARPNFKPMYRTRSMFMRQALRRMPTTQHALRRFADGPQSMDGDFLYSSVYLFGFLLAFTAWIMWFSNPSEARGIPAGEYLVTNHPRIQKKKD